MGDGILKALGISITTNEIAIAILEKISTAKPILIHTSKTPVKKHNDNAKLMDWFESVFIELITQHKPDSVAYRMILNPNKDQIPAWEFPLGVLNLVCFKHSLPCIGYSSSKITGSATKVNAVRFPEAVKSSNYQKYAMEAAYRACEGKK